MDENPYQPPTIRSDGKRRRLSIGLFLAGVIFTGLSAPVLFAVVNDYAKGAPQAQTLSNGFYGSVVFLLGVAAFYECSRRRMPEVQSDDFENSQEP